MRNLKILFFLCFISISSFSQNKQDYYLEIKQGINLGTIQKTVNADETISISSNSSSFSNFINSKEVYNFEKAFPTSVTPKLQRVYIVTLSENETISSFYQQAEVENVELIEEPFLASIYPNDYNETVLDNRQNTALELIRAPLAWSITQGSTWHRWW